MKPSTVLIVMIGVVSFPFYMACSTMQATAAEQWVSAGIVSAFQAMLSIAAVKIT